MKFFIVFAATVALAVATPISQGVSVSQDTSGNYNLEYRTLESSRSEQGFPDGKVVGTFTYQDKDGIHHTIKYVADRYSGFHAEGDLPRPVKDTPEVAHARYEHLAIVEKERSLLPPLREEEEVVYVPHYTVPKYEIDHTAEIEAAKAEHFAAHRHALRTLEDAYAKIQH